ncbi:MAG: hypothetical protein PVH19_08370, partial [Planctomycetia bacterium]
LRNGMNTSHTAPTWSMPVTTTDEERLLANRPIRLPRGSGLIAIDSPSPAMASWMAEACERQGYSVFVTTGKHYDPKSATDVRGVSVVIVDASEGNQAEQTRIQEVQIRWPAAQIMLLLDFPRIEQRRRFQHQGVTTIVSKPLTLEALLWHVQELCPLISNS